MQLSVLSAFVVIAISALAGQRIIGFFGLSIASFQVGGGMLLLLSSLQTLNAQPAESKPNDLSDGDAKLGAGASIAVVPLTIALLTGAATISTRVIYAQPTWHRWEVAVLVGYGVVVGLAVLLAFAASGRISRLLGHTGINIMTRLMGLIVAALVVEIMADGLLELFPVLGSSRLR